MSSDYQDMSLFDFIVLCMRKLKAFFVWCLTLLHHLVHIGCKYWYVVCVCAILGAVYVRFAQKPQTSNFSGEATILFSPNIKPVIESGLQLFINADAKEKGLDSNVAATFVEMKCYNVIDARGDGSVDFTDKSSSVTAVDSLQFVMMDRLTLELKLSDERNYAAFEKALCHFFNSRTEFSAPTARWRESVQRKIFHIDRALETSDTFSLELVNNREALTEALASTPDVINFQTHFVVKSESEPVTESKMKYVYYVLAGILFGLLLSSLIEYRKPIRDFMQYKR